YSRLTGKPITLKWGPNWEDDLAGLGETGAGDANFKNLEFAAYLRFRNVFMFWLPRLCEHCLNPACVASCPSGALYKRDEDGIVLVDQERCRGWRYCVSGCPYKKVYFNWKTGRAEKCIFCYPRIEAGLTTLCAHSCVGRIRYVGVLLYDADRIAETAAVSSDQAVYPAHLDVLLDPDDPHVERNATAQGIAPNMLAAAKRSPTYALIKEWRLALPLHPEFRTLPMVWYVPPLSPVSSQVEPSRESETIDRMRIPMTYLANLLTAGDEAPVRKALKRLSAIRRYMRIQRVEKRSDTGLLDTVELDKNDVEKMYRLLALARLEERFVLPTKPVAGDEDIYARQGRGGFGDAM
ncbi:MAG: 4Fe-4S dicluster domain-containing protein, partial [Deltaproteobacteria bacterium]|nr:4Fe-4S dicluster domain-containing protein [Deltaproteobacteria bacterium]